MKLYYKAGACSLASHIALIEAGFDFTVEAVDLATKKTDGGADFLAINPKGYIPALVLDDGQVLTEGVAILLYLASQAPDLSLAPAEGTADHIRLVEWLVFIATELHKATAGLFNPALPAEAKEISKATLRRRLDFTDQALVKSSYLVGVTPTVADFYLFTVVSWLPRVGIDVSDWPSLAAHSVRIAALPSVQEALKAEKLL
ncbi:glutathione transferase GstA [Magnetospirillum molischianum]|uniref:Glutathione S-transferase n=1 Tax=Magnetospirillum molischianum DSM 120 TaxID=1150626 RepID=H8FPV5_MAGML|nr:glutathione transferase GstA [Magnetospirillum molischianum]CCG40393.1 Glutathione S-transferase [Magnetospirillum molischianum DSM 120]